MIKNISKTLLNTKFFKNDFLEKSPFKTFKPGSILQILYKTVEGTKEKINNYEGILIAKKNFGLSQSLTLRRMVLGIAVEQTFPYNSPNLIQCKLKKVLNAQKSKVSRKAKLYYFRTKKK